MSRTGLHLETLFTPEAADRPAAYSLTLANRSGVALSGFRLCVSGPGRIDLAATITGGTVAAQLSNHTQLQPPQGLVLAPGEDWTISIIRPSWFFRHWTDGARAAYVMLADGTTLPVTVAPSRRHGHNAAAKRGIIPHPVSAVAPVTLSVIPWPAHVAVSGRRSLPAGLALQADDEAGRAAARAFTALTEQLFAVEGLVRSPAEGGIAVTLACDRDLDAEAYTLAFSPDGITVTGATQTGLLYGLITLGQIWRGARHYPETFVFPLSGEISDQPAMGWRGLHLDVARQFYPGAEIKRLLAILAWNKLNRFHWHLSDDEAWRVEIDAYPSLTRIGAWRGQGLAIPPLLGSDAAPTGGYYTKQVIREIVALGRDYGIETVPEIDLPGHCYAMLQSLPHLRDPDETGKYYSVQTFPNNCLNPAREETYAALETILGELIALFPYKTIHVGADEVPLGAWSGSPQALARLAEIGGPDMAEAHARRNNVITNTHGADAIDGSGASVLQGIFLGRIQRFLAQQGCITGGWEEAAHGDVIDKAASYLCGWRDVQISASLALRGYDIVACPAQAYYLDMANTADWDEPGASWAATTTPRQLYDFDPVAGWSDAQKAHLLGIQACIWSEPMADRQVFDRLVFPRLSALAESAWTKPDAKSWDRFAALAGLMPVLHGPS